MNRGALARVCLILFPSLAAAAAVESRPAPPTLVVTEEIAIRMIGQPAGTVTLVLRVPRSLVAGIEPGTEVAVEIRRDTTSVTRVARMGEQNPASAWIPARLFGWTDDGLGSPKSLSSEDDLAILITLPASPSSKPLKAEQTRYDPMSTQLVDVEYRMGARGRLEFVALKPAGRSQKRPVTWK